MSAPQRPGRYSGRHGDRRRARLRNSWPAKKVCRRPRACAYACVPGGCSGFQYSLNIEEESRQGDFILDEKGVRLFVDMFSAQYLNGVEIDYVTGVMGSGFTFKNPNATGSCGCGSSFTA